jgi:hypothetical protein
MRYMLLFRPVEKSEEDAPPCMELSAMGDLIGELGAAGVVLSTEGLHPSERGARVRLAEGRVSVTDGPFTEAKELIAGYVMVDVDSRDDAIELAKRFLAVAGEGQGEVREVMEHPGEA